MMEPKPQPPVTPIPQVQPVPQPLPQPRPYVQVDPAYPPPMVPAYPPPVDPAYPPTMGPNQQSYVGGPLPPIQGYHQYQGYPGQGQYNPAMAPGVYGPMNPPQ